MRSGSVVRLDTGEIGIVISQYKDDLHVLCDDYKVRIVNIKNVTRTGKYFDLSIIWECIKDKENTERVIRKRV